MAEEILRKQAQRLIEAGAQILDVLELREYQESHLPGAVHIHLRKVAEQAHEKLDPSRPVVVYCHDFA